MAGETRADQNSVAGVSGPPRGAAQGSVRAAGFCSSETKVRRMGDMKDHFFDGTWKPSPFARSPEEEPFNANLGWLPESNPTRLDVCHPSLWTVEQNGGNKMVPTIPVRPQKALPRDALPGYRGYIPGKKNQTVYGSTFKAANNRSQDVRAEGENRRPLGESTDGVLRHDSHVLNKSPLQVRQADARQLAEEKASTRTPYVPDGGTVWKCPPDAPQRRRVRAAIPQWVELQEHFPRPERPKALDPIMGWTGHFAQRRFGPGGPLGSTEQSPVGPAARPPAGLSRSASLPAASCPFGMGETIPGGPQSGGTLPGWSAFDEETRRLPGYGGNLRSRFADDPRSHGKTSHA